MKVIAAQAGIKIGFEKKLKIVGVIYDCKLNWSKMTSEMANRGKQALGFLRRLGGLITSPDLAIIYKYFVRSRMEYGCASYIASSSGGLKKLDVVQRRAEKLCGITFQPLGARREAPCFGLMCKLLDEVCVGRPLLDMIVPSVPVRRSLCQFSYDKEKQCTSY